MADVEAPVTGVQATFAQPSILDGGPALSGVLASFSAPLILDGGPALSSALATFASDDLTSFVIGVIAPVTGAAATFTAEPVAAIVHASATVTGAHATFDAGYLETAGSAVAVVSGAPAAFSIAASLLPDLTATVTGAGTRFYAAQLAPFGQDCQGIAADRAYAVVDATDDEIAAASSANTSFTIVTASDHYHDDEVYPPWQ